MTEQTVICIGCPLGCPVILNINQKGEVEGLSGNQCKEGKEYVMTEFRAPLRVFTTTLITEKGTRLLAVRTNKPVHKGELKELMRALSKLRFAPPIKAGQILIPNILGTGADLIASNSI